MPNDPYLDKSVHWRLRTGAVEFREPRQATVRRDILASGIATEVVGLLSAGKEADVYFCRYGAGPLVVKAYRLYRTSHRGGRPVKMDTMGRIAAFEHEMLSIAWKAGVRVPTPARRVENYLAMRYLGGEAGPAPRLKDIAPEDPEAFLDDMMRELEALLRAGVCPGDLSPYNVLVHEGRGWFIDFSDAVRVGRLGIAPWRKLELARSLLTRGLESIRAYFRRHGVALDVDGFVSRMIAELDVRGVLR